MVTLGAIMSIGLSMMMLLLLLPHLPMQTVATAGSMPLLLNLYSPPSRQI
jgi:hypothetical protein